MVTNATVRKRRLLLAGLCCLLAWLVCLEAPAHAAAAPGTIRLTGTQFVALGSCGGLALDATDGPFPRDRSGSIAASTLRIFAGAGCAGAPVTTFTLRAGTTHLDFSFAPTVVAQDQIRARYDDGPLATFAVGVFAQSPTAADPRKAIVVYNTNVPDSSLVAQRYATARGMSPSQVCAVRLPPGYFASPDELLGARRTIVENCICPQIDVAIRPSPCTVGNLAAVAAVSPISHMALARGVPIRLTGTGWTGDGESPSLGYYLSYLVYNDDTIFGIDGKRGIAPSYPPLSALSHHPPALAPATVPWLAYGYVEAADTDRSLALIDRTLLAESRGLSGNLLGEANMDDQLSKFLVKLTSSFAPACSDYLHHLPFIFGDPASSWPWDQCAFGTTGTDPVVVAPGNYPGENATSIPHAVGAVTFLGGNPWPNTQVGFDGFGTMRRWHRAAENCTELCSEFPTPTEVDACRAQSADYFRELNSACVGVRDGFFGGQLRSWPVQYMGFMPAGWTTLDSGDWEKRTPVITRGDAYVDARFRDDKYARWGYANLAGVPQCQLGSGATVECRERIPINIAKSFTFDPPLELTDPGGSRTFRFRVRLRNEASPGAYLLTYGIFDVRSGNLRDQLWPGKWLMLTNARSSWTTWEDTFVVMPPWMAPGKIVIDKATLWFAANVDHAARGHLDIDGIEFYDVTGRRELMDTESGSFSRTDQLTNRAGDLAANIIDRLGGVAAFGSSSHFVTNGWAFEYQYQAAAMLFSGRTLGESLFAAKKHQSGLIFGDPMYRPVAVSLHSEDGSRFIGIDLNQPNVVPRIVAHAYWGGSSVRSLRWTLSSCESADVALCSGNPYRWSDFASGVGAVDGASIDWGSMVPPGNVPRQFTLRLQVSDPRDVLRSWSSYVLVQVAWGKPDSPPEPVNPQDQPPMESGPSVPVVHP